MGGAGDGPGPDRCGRVAEVRQADGYSRAVAGSVAGALAGLVAGWGLAAVLVPSGEGSHEGLAGVLIVLGIIVTVACTGSVVGCYTALRADGAARAGATAAWMLPILGVGILFLATGVATVAAVVLGPLLARRLALRGP